ncbi:hypothetical protein OFDDKENP_00166 [Aeromonas phage B614]|nr:hypothetical protein OFDDKENP_00166 [Aeromonas phage B614]UYD58106.1 hypothetical protein JNEOFJEA_00009 [Aeromonas phage UP87]UYD58470.1 hypothetical protein IPAKJDPM_00127 [Aeromonas phage avDM14-QBC]UYD58686.1 hypothetical protein HNNIDBEH_00093 [Aeromonas phage avDM10-HWA]UYD59011.1 hypothetical protein OFOPOMKI_00161 [Aeromonas phage avDM7-IJDJ]UYD59823.1 hypothetical protein LEHPIFIF_00050 [Aeromonas phage avDM9-HANS]
MQITFKSEEHRKSFASAAKCNEWIAHILGMDTWECREEPMGDYDRTPALAVLDGFGEQIAGIFEHNDRREEDHAWVFWNERKYFDITE